MGKFKIGYSEEARKRINAVVKRVEAMPHLPEERGTDSYVVQPYMIDLMELETAPALDSTSKMYKASARLCWMAWCTVDGNGHYVAPVSEYATGAVKRWRKDTTKPLVDVYFPATAIDSYQEATVGPPFKVGDRVYVTGKENKRVALQAASSLTPRILYDDVAPGGNGQAYPVDSSMAADTGGTKVTVYSTFPGTYRGLGTNHTGFTPSPAAMIWTAMGTDGHEHIVSGVGQAKKCTAALTADASPGGSVTVDTVVSIDGGQLPVANSTSATIASCGMPADASALDNAPCIIEWDETNDTWKITWVHQRAKQIRGTLSAAMAAGDASQTISTPVSCDGGQVPSGTFTGYNVFGHAGDSGGEVFLVWNENTDHYEIIQCECPA